MHLWSYNDMIVICCRQKVSHIVPKEFIQNLLLLISEFMYKITVDTTLVQMGIVCQPFESSFSVPNSSQTSFCSLRNVPNNSEINMACSFSSGAMYKRAPYFTPNYDFFWTKKSMLRFNAYAL